LRIAANPPHKGEIKEFIDYLERAVSELGVEIKLGASVTVEEVAGMPDFNEVVVAAGAEPICPPLPDTEKGGVGVDSRGLGGGMVGCETAECLALAGKKVIVVEQLPQLASDLEVRIRKLLLNRLEEHKVDTMANTKVESVEMNKVVCAQAGVRFEIEGVDTIVLALGYRAGGLLAQSQAKKLHVIGDCIQPRKVTAAVHEGVLLGTVI
jgi:NADPH-dependent 2,4-dienoyl-CoA reductase/sulfur reductase-like enzyme